MSNANFPDLRAPIWERLSELTRDEIEQALLELEDGYSQLSMESLRAGWDHKRLGRFLKLRLDEIRHVDVRQSLQKAKALREEAMERQGRKLSVSEPGAPERAKPETRQGYSIAPEGWVKPSHTDPLASLREAWMAGARFVSGGSAMVMGPEEAEAFELWLASRDSPRKCPDCDGEGQRGYGDTTMGRGGAGGQMITVGMCHRCRGLGHV